MSRRIALIALLVIAAVGAYSNTFDAPFVFDDYQLFTSPFLAQPELVFDHEQASRYDSYRFLRVKTRPVGVLSFALNRSIGGYDPGGYRAFNLMVHVLSTLALYALVLGALGSPRFRGAPLEPAAFGAALLFAVHPVQTQAVTYVIQRFTSMGAFFYIGSLAAYVWGRRTGGARGRALYVLCIVLAALAMKTKENAITLPLMAAMMEFALFEGQWRRRLIMLAPLMAAAAIVPLSMAGLSMTELAAQSRVDSALPRIDYLIVQAKVVATYLRLLLLPVNQMLDYDYPLSHDLFGTGAALVLHGALIGCGAWLALRGRAAHHVLAGIGILWFYLALSVESSVFPIMDVIFEHRMYLPAAGLFMAGSALMAGWFGGRRGLALIVALSLVLGVATYARNGVWGSDVMLWEDNALKAPGKSRVHNNLGRAYVMARRAHEAEAAYARAISLDPSDARAYTNLGVLYLDMGKADKARYNFQMALFRDPGYLEAARYLNFMDSQGGR